MSRFGNNVSVNSGMDERKFLIDKAPDGFGSYPDHGAIQGGDKDGADDDPFAHVPGRASIPSSIFNLMNTMIGGGTVAIPFAFASAGLIGGGAVLILICVMSDYTQGLLIKCGALAGKMGGTYENVGRKAFGMKGVRVVQAVELVNTFGCLASYLVIISDQAKVFDIWMSDDNILLTGHAKVLLAICVVALIVPLSMLRNMSLLAIPSLLSLMCILYTGVVVVSNGASFWGDGHDCGPKLFDATTGFFFALPIMTLGFTSHINIYNVYSELTRRSPGRMQIVSHTSMFLALVFYAAVGVLGYSNFCALTNGDILINYGSEVIPAQVARIAMMVSFVFTYPILCYPCRHALDSILFNHRPFTWTRHIVETLIIVACSYVVAILVPFIVVVFSLMGAITATMLVFILPTAFYLKLAPGPMLSAHKILPMIVFAIGTIFGSVATATIIYNISQGQTGSG